MFIVLSLCWFQKATYAQNIDSIQVTLQSVDGTPVDLNKAVNKLLDKPVMICTWATWSVYGSRNMTSLSAYLKEQGLEKEFNLLGISMDDEKHVGRVPKYAEYKGQDWLFEIYMDVNQELNKKKDISFQEGLVYLFTSEGEYLRSYSGGLTDELKAAIKQLSN